MVWECQNDVYLKFQVKFLLSGCKNQSLVTWIDLKVVKVLFMNFFIWSSIGLTAYVEKEQVIVEFHGTSVLWPCLKARLHRRFLSRQLNAIFVSLKLQLQNGTCKPGAIFRAISCCDIAYLRCYSQNTVTLNSSFANAQGHKLCLQRALVDWSIAKIVSTFFFFVVVYFFCLNLLQPWKM